MTCPKCGEDTKVIDSRSECDSVLRTRQCVACDYRFKTIELDNDLFEKIVEHTHVDQRKGG